jgi:RNA ligase (TIGR02306 family)
MRKLASVKVIKDKKPIEGADRIEAVQIDWWWCVAKKDEFQVGEKCIYCEVDSVLPIREEYEFLRKSCYVKKDWIEGFRLRSIKLKKQLSQGLVMPIGKFADMEIGTDLTEILGVKKWDPPVPACLAGEAKGNFPSWISKTDQERVQSFYDELVANYKEHFWEGSLKMDGSSLSLYVYNDTSGVCSRNIELKTGEENANNTFVQIYHKYIDKIKSLGRNIGIAGELLAPKIQGNREGLLQAELFVFDMFDIDKQQYLVSEERYQICKQLGLVHVPVINPSIQILKYSLEQILEMSDIPSMNHSIAEGIVYKSLQDPSVSFKAINNKFLLKEE